MEISVSLPTDSDGFLSQECPSCGQRFKALFGEGSSEPISYCPYCGHTGQQCWHTPEQVEYLQAVASYEALGPEIDKLKRELKRSSGGFVKFDLKANIPKPPPPPMETDEPLDILRFPCCDETVKVSKHGSLFCVICGKVIDMEASERTKVFLSHKGVDKSMVIDFQKTLELLGYSPWLDEDAMPAGTALERGIHKGMQDSCAVVFFITPAFKDAGYLETEINYAVAERRAKGDKFAIVTLQFGGDDGMVGEIPDLLRPFVWKRPKSPLDALREIIRALPVMPGLVGWREGIAGVSAIPRIKSTLSPLSDEAKSILKAAVGGDGIVVFHRFLGGEGIQAGGKSLIPNGSDGRTVAKWIGGLEDLKRRRFISARGSRGETFEVTREGYEAADELE